MEGELEGIDNDDDYNHINFPESRLELLDILPLDPKKYDKNRPPRPKDQPTIVDFHVTVLSLDSINEESMVRFMLELDSVTTVSCKF